MTDSGTLPHELSQSGVVSAFADLPRSQKVILVIDMVESVRAMSRDESGTVSRWRQFVDGSVATVIPQHQGRLVKSLGDGLMVEFDNSVQAVNAAFAMHLLMSSVESNAATAQAILLRGGIHRALVFTDAIDIYGSGVNLAARLCALASPGETVVSGSVRDDLVGALDILIDDWGECMVKHLDHPVRAFRVGAPSIEPNASARLRARPTLAVLPFANLSDSTGQEYFADGLSEDIIASLSHSPWLFVIARGSSFSFRESSLGTVAICRRLGVKYLVSGSVRRAGERLRVSVDLSDGATGESVWSERYERPLVDLFALQDDIASKVVGTIEPLFLKQEEHHAVNDSGRDIAHWDLLMRARWHYWRSSRKHSEEGKRLLEQALVMRPNDVEGLSLMSFSLLTDVWSGWSDDPKAMIERATLLSRRAISINERNSFSHFTMGVAMACMGDMKRAIAEQRRALALYPHFAAAAAELGRLLAFSGESAQAVAEVHAAMAASPTDPRLSLWLFTLGIAAFVEGRYDAASEFAADAVAQRPDWFFNHYLLAATLAAADRLEPARKALAEGVRLMPQVTVATLTIGHPFTQEQHRNSYIGALRKAGWQG